MALKTKSVSIKCGNFFIAKMRAAGLSMIYL